jgi:predicted PurR-regulated permease PerM
MAATGAGLYVCYLMALPFLPALAWALALAILFAPLQRAIEGRLKQPDIAAAVCVLSAALIAVAPTIFVAERLINEGAKGAVLVQAQIEAGAWRRALEAHPTIAPMGKWLNEQIDLPAIFGNAASWLTNASASLVQRTAIQLAGLLLTFYLLFYFLRDRRLIVATLKAFSPLADAEMDSLFRRIGDTVFATLYGVVLVGALQGLLGGLMFWLLNLPTPLLWGLVMGFLAMAPVLGAFMVWLPAAAFLSLNGNWASAAILIAGGALLAGVGNLAQLKLVGDRLKLHTTVSFIALIGGLYIFGASGLILGPLAVTITLALLDIWRTRIADAPE